MLSVTLREGDAHEQYHLSRRPRRDCPRDLGLSRITLARRAVARPDLPPAYACAGRLAGV
jgi:hypothetical protein